MGYSINKKEFESKELLFDYIRENKKLLILEKKAITKHADLVSSFIFSESKEDVALEKAVIDSEVVNLDSMTASVVINTTNIMDSHSDVHIPGIWNKSLKEQKILYLLKEHKMEFESIISDQVKAIAKTISWKELGYDLAGNTQALIFNAKVLKARNEYMFNQYAKGYVKNHSVGMRYVQLDLAMNSSAPSDKEEKKIWDKYINQIVNKEVAEEKGYFWAVTEAKIVEGSAVPLGSNYATPTLSIGKESNSKQLESDTLDNEAVIDTLSSEPEQSDVAEKERQEKLKMFYLKLHTK